MADKVRISDPYGILREFNPNAPAMVDVHPAIEATLSNIADRDAKGIYLEPYFFHPDEAVQSLAATASIELTQSKFSDYLTNVLATATQATTMKAVATIVWQTDRMEGVVDALRAYIHTNIRAKARQIINTLLEYAPDDASRMKLKEEASSRGANLLNL